MISCRVLGPVEVSVKGGPAPPELLWRKNLALLVYLACSPKRTRSRDHLVGLLWGDKPEAAARHSLNESMRVLRKYLGADGLESEGGQVRLAPQAAELDVERFESLAAEANWSEAARLVAGEFMEGFSVPGCSELEEWLHAERSSWRERSVETLVASASELLDAGELRKATSLARRALALDATSKVAVEAAMRSLAIAGERAAALALYQTFTERLAEEIGIEPDEETQALAERIRRERAWKLPERLAEIPPGAESRRSPLVGRETELAQLVDAWNSCRHEGRAVLGVIDGDPGTGKSRLAEELEARARLDGAIVTSVRAVEADTGETWNGLLGLARGLPLGAPGLESAPPAALVALAKRLPDWGERWDAQARTESLPGLGRAFAEVAAAVAARQPVFLSVDDTQWLDRESLLALGALLRDLANAPVFVLVTQAMQPERAELAELRARIGRELAGAKVRVGPLTVAALRLLARWALPSYDEIELDRVTRRVATDSAGLPLLALELLHAVAMGFDLAAAGKAWPEPYHTLDQTLPGELPDAVVAAVRVGFRRLSQGAQAALAAASVLGDRVDEPTLRRATDLSREALAAALDELEWQRWLAADSRGYSFVARIVREVIARDMLTPGQRRRIQELAATR